MKRIRFVSFLVVVPFIGLFATHLSASIAAAHPLGNFSVNQYVGLHLNRQEILVDYVLDMAEIPAFQEIAAFDTNQNNRADAAEARRYQLTQCETIGADLVLRLNDRLAPLILMSSAVEFPSGAGNLSTLRLTCGFQIPLALSQETISATFENNVYSQRLGWREIVITSDGVVLQGDLTTMGQSLSQRLTAYPDNLLTSPLNQRQISFDLLPVAPVRSQMSQPSILSTIVEPPIYPSLAQNDHFTQLITQQNFTLPAILLALAIAFLWGAAHALTPGHGKTIVAAYLVGTRGTARHALFLGLTTTITHTIGVFVLGGITLFVSAFVLPERLYPWLSAGSGLLVVGIGLSLLRNRLGHLFRPKEHNHHDHDHDHNDHNHDHAHHHHSHAHSHLPPGADGSPITWRQLLALGASGGLLPCPSALIVMLSAIALQRIGFGLVLIFVFSLGLASVLTTIGLMFVYAGQLFERLPWQKRLLPILPAVSAFVITIIGAGITWQALREIGTWPL